MGGRNPRYYAVGGWRARNAAIAACRARAAAGEPCALCGQPIDVTRAWIIEDGRRVRDPLSCECDEVIPVSRGGSPVDLENVRPVHRICNEKRGADVRGDTGRSKALCTAVRVSAHAAAAGVSAGRW